MAAVPRAGCARRLVVGQVANRLHAARGRRRALHQLPPAAGRRSPGSAPSVVTGAIALPRQAYPDDPGAWPSSSACWTRCARCRAWSEAGATTNIPFGAVAKRQRRLARRLDRRAAGQSFVSPDQIRVSPGYFEAMGIPLLTGRAFDGSEVEGSRAGGHRGRAAGAALLARSRRRGPLSPAAQVARGPHESQARQPAQVPRRGCRAHGEAVRPDHPEGCRGHLLLPLRAERARRGGRGRPECRGAVRGRGGPATRRGSTGPAAAALRRAGDAGPHR